MSSVRKPYALTQPTAGPIDSRRWPGFVSGVNRYALSLLLALAVVLTWQAVTFFFSIQKWLLPSPWEVVQALGANWGLIAGHTLVTAREALIGFAVAVAVVSALAEL